MYNQVSINTISLLVVSDSRFLRICRLSLDSMVVGRLRIWTFIRAKGGHHTAGLHLFVARTSSPDLTMSVYNDKDTQHESAAIDTIYGFPLPSWFRCHWGWNPIRIPVISAFILFQEVTPCTLLWMWRPFWPWMRGCQCRNRVFILIVPLRCPNEQISYARCPSTLPIIVCVWRCLMMSEWSMCLVSAFRTLYLRMLIFLQISDEDNISGEGEISDLSIASACNTQYLNASGSFTGRIVLLSAWRF